ncbi:endonuclease/exonuclease/phosphatase family protein [Pseudonocardia sp.]|uniref:endonuclease/exonuclease/phosphatase family protein n=1 Tax=Pseudonocardia sp. TaxID=60912 RepID=UPI002611B7DE|nr:endonuclease/exonuclease/phosphatase family protein [Pseudonocardia sp.]
MVGHEEATSDAPPAGRRWWVLAGTLAAAALPWLWFAVRDRFGAVTDVVAIGIPLLVAGAVLGSVLVAVRRRPSALLVGVSALLAGALAVVGPWVPADLGAVDGPGVRVAGANVDDRRSTTPTLTALAPDVLSVAELSPGLRDALTEQYPHELFTDGDRPRLGVFSRYPLRLLEPAGPDLPGLRVRVDAPTGPFVLYALHIPRPWFTSEGEYQTTVVGHHALVERVAERVRGETLPAVVVGDLNSTDRGRDYRALVRPGVLGDAMLDTWGAPTSVGKWLPLLGRIDHVLVTGGWCGDDAGHAALPGSSHRAVLATVGPCAGGGG